MLNRDDYPDLTDEQWDAIQAEFDRRATDASKTARKNAEKELLKNQQAAIEAAVAEERARLEMDEQQKLEAERKKIDEAKAALAAERKSMIATKKLLAAGIAEDKAEALLPMFVGVGDDALDTTLDGFIKTYQDTVKAEVDATKQTLLKNAAPPASPTDAPAGGSATAQALIEKGDAVGALDALLDEAGYGV